MTVETAVQSLEEALQIHEARVADLLKVCTRLNAQVKAWKKACDEGHVVAIQKAQAQVAELLPILHEKSEEAAGSWSFDAREYLESGRWRQELAEAGERLGLKVLQEGEHVISFPVLVSGQPRSSQVRLGKKAWPKLRPRVLAGELKKLREKTSSSGSQEFVEHLYRAWVDLTRDGGTVATFQALYDRFCQAPGWKKDNPREDFGLQILKLARSDVRMTKAGKRFHIEFPSGRFKEADIFVVYREDGQPARYYGIEFR